MNTVNLDFAIELGKKTATFFNENPNNDHDFGLFQYHDDLPESEYNILENHYTEIFNENYTAIEMAYKKSFNETINK